MQYKADTVDGYFEQIPEERRPIMKKLEQVINENLPEGFKQGVSYGMMGWVVPHNVYPSGYHCDPKQPLPFMSIASQKNFIAVYHMGMYAGRNILDWFTGEYPKYVKTKLDMGKSCIRFKKPENIPFELIGQLASKLTPQDWISMYEANLKSVK